MTTRLTSTCGKFSAWIEVEKEPLAVHQISSITKRTEGYICASVGKEFVVGIGCPSPTETFGYPSWEARIFIDGRDCAGRIIDPENQFTNMVEGRRFTFDEAFCLYSSLFSNQKIFVEASAAQELAKQDHNNLGTIEIRFQRSKRLGDDYGEQRPAEGYERISEENKKIRLGSLTKFGSAKPVEYAPFARSEVCPADERTPVYTLSFIYTTKELLQALEIIPCTALKNDTTAEEETYQEKLMKAASLIVQSCGGPKLSLPPPRLAGQKRKATDMLPLSGSGENLELDVQRNLKIMMAAKLIEAKGRDGGRVDLTGDED